MPSRLFLNKWQCGSCAFGESLQTPAVHEEQIQPAIVVVVVEGEAAASGFEQIFVVTFPAVDGLDVEPGLLHDVDEADAQRRAFNRRLGTRRRRRGLRVVASLLRPDLRSRLVESAAVAGRRQCHDVCKRQNQRGAAKRTNETCDDSIAYTNRSLAHLWPLPPAVTCACVKSVCMCQGTLSVEISGCLRR